VAFTTLKQPIGRPQKQLHAILIVEKEVKQEDNKEDEISKSINYKKKKYLHQLVCATPLAFHSCCCEDGWWSH
jgi:hypothetical protein